MAELVEYRREGGIGIITVDNPPVNALGQAVRQGLLDALDRGLGDPRAAALVLRGAGRTFMAGADIREFGKPPAPPGLGAVIARYEASPKLLVAAIHGTALGGGLETALACHYRCALRSARVGFPEVKLGLLPGAGGTQRLPRLIGVAAALEMIVGGEPVPAARALELGIVDELLDGELLAGAIAFAERLLAEQRPLRVIARDDARVRGVPEAVFEEARRRIARRARGFLAPWKCLESVQAATALPFAAGLERERALFQECLASPQSRAQIHVFFAEREAGRLPEPAAAARPIRRAAVIGAGTMGGGIAMSLAGAGIPVTVLEVDRQALDRGLAAVRRNYAATVARGRLAPAEMEARLDRIRPALSYDDLADVDLVIEAVFEELPVKQAVFRRLDVATRADAVLATNTSTLDIDAIARATGRPAQVVGTHFFSPAHVMRLLEIVRGAATAPETVATAMGLARALGKIGVVVGNCDGFVGNRMLAPYLREAEFMVEEGALPQDIDRALEAWGLAMGPFTMSDMAGLDVGWRIRQRQAATRPPGERYPPLADRLCERGRFGLKTGAGWYRYEAGDRTPRPDPEVERLILDRSRELGLERRPIGEEEIRERCLYALVNEGARILAEGIARRPGDIDVVYVYGYGFPAYRGGPMFWADEVGLPRVHDAVRRLHDRHGALWAPAPLLGELARTGRRFADL